MAQGADAAKGVTKYFSLHEDDPPPPAGPVSSSPSPPRAGKGPDPRSARPPGLSEGRFIVHAAWIAWSLVSAAAAACWGFRLGSRAHLDAIWAELGRMGELQAEQAQQAKRLAASVASCVTEVRGPGAPGRWELIRLDGGEAGTIDLGVVDLRAKATAAGGAGLNSKKSEPGESSGASATKRTEPPLPLPPLPSQRLSLASKAQSLAEPAEAFPELMCQEGQHGAWKEVKEAASLALGGWRAGFVLQDVQTLGSLLETAVQRLQAVQGSVTDCGMGRLSMSVLAVLTDDPNHSLQGARDVHAPLLTVLLEIHWSAIVWSGWPLFALLGQLQLYASAGSGSARMVGPGPQAIGVSAAAAAAAAAGDAAEEEAGSGGQQTAAAPAAFLSQLREALLREQRPSAGQGPGPGPGPGRLAELAELAAAFLTSLQGGGAPQGPLPGHSPPAPNKAQAQVQFPAGTMAATSLGLAPSQSQPELQPRPGDAEDPMAVLCALACLLLRPDLQSASRGEVEEALRRVQSFYRQSVRTMADLQASMATAWPLYGILHAAAVQLNSPDSGS